MFDAGWIFRQMFAYVLEVKIGEGERDFVHYSKCMFADALSSNLVTVLKFVLKNLVN